MFGVTTATKVWVCDLRIKERVRSYSRRASWVSMQATAWVSLLWHEAVDLITFVRSRGEDFSEIFDFCWQRGTPDASNKIGNDSPCQCDQFCPKIIEIGAILAIFRLFEVFPGL